MRLNLSLLALLALTGMLCLTSACGSQKAGNAQAGKVKLSTRPDISGAAHANTGSTAVCATFSATPYQLTSTGPVLAGAPVTFATGSGSSYTDVILGCIDSGSVVNFQAATGVNWAYLVSATNFTYCDDVAGSHPLPASTVSPGPAFFAPIHCTKSIDMALVIDYPISISVVAPTGDIDISAGVSVTNQFSVCKQADFGTVAGAGFGDLHFGTGFVIDSTTSTPKTAEPFGLIGLGYAAGVTDTSASHKVAQYAGQNWAADPDGEANTQLYNTYYTAQIPGGDAAPRPSAIFQTTLSDPTQTHMFGVTDTGCGTTGRWANSNQPYCLTTNADTAYAAGHAAGGTFTKTTNQPTTVAGVASAFIYAPGGGFAAASMSNTAGLGSQINIIGQYVINSSLDYSAAAALPRTANAAAGTASTFGNPDTDLGFNDQLSIQNVPGGNNTAYTFSGVYINPDADGFLVGASFPLGITKWNTLTVDATGTWALGGSWTDLSSGAVPDGFGVQATAGCVAPAVPCPFTTAQILAGAARYQPLSPQSSCSASAAGYDLELQPFVYTGAGVRAIAGSFLVFDDFGDSLPLLTRPPSAPSETRSCVSVIAAACAQLGMAGPVGQTVYYGCHGNNAVCPSGQTCDAATNACH